MELKELLRFWIKNLDDWRYWVLIPLAPFFFLINYLENKGIISNRDR